MSGRAERKLSSYFEAIWLVILALGAWYTAVQFGYTVYQLYTPLLSYDVTKSTSSITPLETTMILPFVLAIRNDGFRDSDEVDVAVSIVGNLPYQYRFDSLSQYLFWSSTYSQFYEGDINGPAGSRFYYARTGFLTIIPSIPALSIFKFSFNVTTAYPIFVFAPVHITTNITVLSDDRQVTEDSPAYRTQTRATQYLFYMYSIGIIAAMFVGLPWAVRRQRRKEYSLH